jgi:hypothetical protein
VSGAVGGAPADVAEVHHRLVIVPVIGVHGIVARAVRALQVGLPGFAGRDGQVADVAGVDRVLRVFLRRVVQRDTERAPARQGQVVGVAGVFLGVELGQQAALPQQAVRERRLPGVADDLAGGCLTMLPDYSGKTVGNATPRPPPSPRELWPAGW